MEISKSLVKVLEKWAKKTESKMYNLLSSGGKGNSNIAQRLKMALKVKSDEIILETDLPEYAIFVDKGRRPGKQPPINTIEGWCKRKGIPTSAAFPIARKIGERGLKGTGFLKPLEDFRDLIEELTKETVKVVSTEIKDIAKQAESESTQK